jgi:putative glutamine amidotransferase
MQGVVMSKRPVVGLNGDLQRISRWGEAATVMLTYVRALARAGAAPLVIPPTSDEGTLAAVLARMDGLVFTGGYDLPPRWFGQAKHPRTRLADRRRLEGDRLLAQLALAGDLPLLGICMGCQLLNVALGGDLIQHIPEQVPGAVPHAPREMFHAARIEAGSRLAAILGREALEVNSSHHQALGRLGKGLRAVAWAPDGVIEAAEVPGERFLLAVQWHPERLVDRPEHLAIFQALVQAASAPSASPR